MMLKNGTQAAHAHTKQGQQDSFMWADYTQYERAGYPFCKKAMHKAWQWGAVTVDGVN